MPPRLDASGDASRPPLLWMQLQKTASAEMVDQWEHEQTLQTAVEMLEGRSTA